MSVFKYFVAVKFLHKIENEHISPDIKITVNEDMVYNSLYSPMLKKYLYFPFEISIENLLTYMISESDNNACDILIEFTGGVAKLEKFIHDTGFTNIEISVTEKDIMIS